ncbi:hypothetical protein D9758_009098 [Tetrapyrgos nigripes]|uniref:Zn(2)-C6 fungal-type domain-containing protein n=1 Tax=Tetrapyrgos nigripes TaxID=182062 RepID=A0A8H5LKT2_9AGAR|nr:hypothetical protein D9758_009098 [Tetrapyrgos nigripes]
MSPESSTGTLETVKPRRKKPPACDYCKARRVLCHPQPEGRSCPRCLEKGVKCTTTPTVRKKRRRQREILEAKKAQVTTRDGDNTNEDDIHSMDLITAVRDVDDARTSHGQELAAPRALTLTKTSAAQYAPQTHTLATLSAGLNNVYRIPIAFAPVSSRPQLQLPKRLMQDLFNDFVPTPHYFHPIMPYDRVRARLAGCDWQPSSLSPHECVLVHCIFALASTVSTDPLIIGTEPFPEECNNILTTIHPVKKIRRDLREIGKRRERVGLCHQLKAEALRQAQNEGIAVWVSPENAASCSLLGALVSQYDGPSPYSAAFAWQARRLAESWYQQPQLYDGIFGTLDRSVRWAAFLMVDVLEALHSDRSVNFSAHDEKLICGHDQLSLEELASLLSQGCNSWQFYEYYLSITFQITHLAREVYQRIRGPCTRGRHYDLQLIKRYAASLHLLQDVSNAFNEHGVLLARRNRNLSYLILSIVRMASIGWTHLTLHFYKTMREILEESSVTDLYAATRTSGPHGINIIDGLDGYGNGGLDSVNGLERGTHNYSSMAELELTPVFLAVRTLTCKAAIEFSETIEDMYYISRLAETKIVGGDFKRWVEFVIDVMNAGVMSANEGIQTLERLRDALKIAGFSWTDHTDLVKVIDSHVSAHMDSSASAQDPAHIVPLDHDPDYYHRHPNPHWDSQNVPQSGSTTAAHPDLHHNPDIDYRNLNINSSHVPSAGVSSGQEILLYDPLFSGYTYASLSSDFHSNHEC